MQSLLDALATLLSASVLPLASVLALRCTCRAVLPHCNAWLVTGARFHIATGLPDRDHAIAPRTLAPALVCVDAGAQFTQVEFHIRRRLPAWGRAEHLAALPASTRDLVFARRFVGNIIALPPNLTSLTFGNAFDSPLDDVLPRTLVHLRFGANFDSPLDLRSLVALRVLRLGLAYDQEPGHGGLQLAPALQTLTFGDPTQLNTCRLQTHDRASVTARPLMFQRTSAFDSLACGRRSYALCHSVYRHSDLPASLPATLRTLQYGTMNDEPSCGMLVPPQLQTLILGACFNSPLADLPATLRTLVCGIEFDQPLDAVLPPGLTTLVLCAAPYSHRLDGSVLPRALTALTLMGGDASVLPTAAAAWPPRIRCLDLAPTHIREDQRRRSPSPSSGLVSVMQHQDGQFHLSTLPASLECLALPVRYGGTMRDLVAACPNLRSLLVDEGLLRRWELPPLLHSLSIRPAVDRSTAVLIRYLPPPLQPPQAYPPSLRRIAVDEKWTRKYSDEPWCVNPPTIHGTSHDHFHFCTHTLH